VSASAPPAGRPLAFLSTLSAVDAFVLRAVCAVHPQVHLVHLVDEADPNRAPLRRRVLAHPWQSVSGRLREILQAPRYRRMERRIARALFGANGTPAPETLGAEAITRAPTWQARSPTLAERLAEIAPDRMIVCGAPWLPGRLCEVPVHGSFNVHWGIAPEYRGGNSTFWALSEGRTDRIGVTIHDITPRIDAGDIVAQGTVSVEADDDETTLWVRCAREAATLAAALAALPASRPLERRPQGEGGRNYRYAQRTLARELAYAVRRRVLGRRPVPAEGKRHPPRLMADVATEA
jgi:folate-dependent phosphoribosylglycinamide formyltransferase PurN